MRPVPPEEEIRQIMMRNISQSGIDRIVNDKLEEVAQYIVSAGRALYPRSGRTPVPWRPTADRIYISRKRWPDRRFVIFPHPAFWVEFGHIDNHGKMRKGEGYILRILDMIRSDIDVISCALPSSTPRTWVMPGGRSAPIKMSEYYDVL